MAVVQATIKSALISLYNSAKENKMSESDFADGMATIIKDAILSATVNSNIPVTVSTGTGIGATTATGTLS
jgi:hypothetical protein